MLIFGFFVFIRSPSRSTSTVIPKDSGGGDDASGMIADDDQPLSPPTSPFRKMSSSEKKKMRKKKKKNGGGQRKPPPVVHYHLNNLTTSATPIAGRETVLILTPLARFYPAYWENLLRLTYPHELISLGFIIPKTREGNAATTALQAEIAKTQHDPHHHHPSSPRQPGGAAGRDERPQKSFASITILRQDFEPAVTSQDEAERHKMSSQKARRAAMARARNSLLFTTLGPSTAWVLWLDSDIVETPESLIQDLASHDKPIIVPNCYQRYTDSVTGQARVRAYDFNSWRDSDAAQQLAAKMGRDEILLEGYHDMPTWRTLLAYQASDPEYSSSSSRSRSRSHPSDLKGGGGGDSKKGGGNRPADERMEVELDGVGGTALLVKAEVHRDGAMFPPFAFYHLIETEGFAKMARRLGWRSWGLPNYLVIFLFLSPPLLIQSYLVLFDSLRLLGTN